MFAGALGDIDVPKLSPTRMKGLGAYSQGVAGLSPAARSVREPRVIMGYHYFTSLITRSSSAGDECNVNYCRGESEGERRRKLSLIGFLLLSSH